MAEFDVRFVERIRPARRVWVWTLALLLLLPALFAGVALAGVFGMLVTSVAVVLFAPLLAERVAVVRVTPATLALEHAALLVSGERIARDVIRGGFDVPGEGIVLDLTDGTSVKLGVDDADASQLLEELGVGADRRTLRMPLRGTVGAFTIGFVSFFAAAMVFSLGLAFLPRLLGPFSILLTTLVLPALTAWGLVRRFGSPHVVVGLDGVRIYGLGRVRFVPRADIMRVRGEHETSELVIERRRGVSLSLPIVGVTRDRVDGLIRRLERMSQEPEGVARIESMLARSGRSVQAWRDALANVAGREMGFREMPVAVEDLARVLGDHRASPELRVGAALALRVAEPEGAAAKIRVAASTTAEEELRAVLEAIAEDDAAEAPIERVTRAR